ncbi:hypothetical protein GCM10023191_022730 [Actinoallomurus oryzae]|uniref:Uncharacterized protein n=1 Tax=Actinoallomurus oryzae TaxID=502180 RepID=A0ABP8PS62_9ACTN
MDQWPARKAKQVSTRTLQELRSILKRSVARAQVRDKVKRNVVLLCQLPKGRPGRPSKSLTLDQAVAVLTTADTAKPQAPPAMRCRAAKPVGAAGSRPAGRR